MIWRNILANYGGRAWGFVSVYLFIPIYLKILGADSFGLVGFYTTMLGVFSFADLGITATLNREMARLAALPSGPAGMAPLLKTYETVYAVIAILVGALVFLLSPVVARAWLQSATLTADEITTVLHVLGVALVLQLMAGLYVGGLMGMQKQVGANGIQFLWGLVRGVGAVIILWQLSPTIYAFALWQVVSNVLYLYVARRSLWTAVKLKGEGSKAQFDSFVLRRTWQFAAGMTSMALISTILSQTDKLIVSRLMSLEMVGYYSIASSLAAIPLILASPVTAAVLPRFTGLIALGERSELVRLYHNTCSLVSIAVIPATVVLMIFAKELIATWISSDIVADETWLAAILLLSGQFMQAISIAPYYVAVAHGDFRLNISLGLASILIITPILIILTSRYGIAGAAMSWLILNILNLPVFIGMLHAKFLPGELVRWCVSDVGKPLVAVLAMAMALHLILPAPVPGVSVLWQCVVTGSLCSLCALLASRDARSVFIQRVRHL
jgi:O-antigen/teichoic acid export membrane protein